MPSVRCWVSVTSESWLPLETTSGTPAPDATRASRRTHVFSTAVPLTTGSAPGRPSDTGETFEHLSDSDRGAGRVRPSESATPA